VAIKGKTKRSQGRPVRRPATGPRIQSVERRQPWYRATAFPVMLAVITLLVTLFGAWNRLEEGWARDDLQRFTAKLRVQTDQLAAVTGAGTAKAPGFSSAANLAKGTLKPADLATRASGWSAKIQQIGTAAAGITVGKVATTSSLNGVPPNNVGGRVPALSSIRDAYLAAMGFYAQAASTYQAAGAESNKTQAQKLVSLGDSDATAAGAAMDTAAAMLARLYGSYDLDTAQQMPGESSSGYSSRNSAAASPGLTTST